MNKSEIIAKVAVTTGQTVKNTTAIIDEFLTAIRGEMAKGGKVELKGFGVFKSLDKPAHDAVNPVTREKLIVPAHKVAVFKPSSVLKEQINGGRVISAIKKAPAEAEAE